MWEINIGVQLAAFAVSVCLGGALCILYGLFSAFRRAAASGKTAVFFQDIIYFSVSAVITFVFLTAFTNGEVRAYFIFGEVLGFALIKISLYKIFVNAVIKTINFLKKIFSSVSGAISCVFNTVFSFLIKIFKKTLKIFKKCKKNSCKESII